MDTLIGIHDVLLNRSAQERTWVVLLISIWLVILSITHAEKRTAALITSLMSLGLSILTVLGFENMVGWSGLSAAPLLMLGATVALVYHMYLAMGGKEKHRGTAVLSLVGWVVALSASFKWAEVSSSTPWVLNGAYVTAWVAAMLPAVLVLLMIFGLLARRRQSSKKS